MTHHVNFAASHWAMQPRTSQTFAASFIIMSDYESDYSEFSFDDASEDEPFDQSPPQESNRSIAIEYRMSTLEDFIYDEFIAVASKMQNLVLQMTKFDDLLLMLHYSKWQQYEMMDAYYDHQLEFFTECGINGGCTIEQESDYMCMICCECYQQVDVFSLDCGHKYCINCYGEYVKNEVPHGNLIRCMDPLCNLSISHLMVQKLYDRACGNDEDLGETTGDLRQIYGGNVLLKAATKAYILGRKRNYKWCPAPDCDGMVQILGRRYKEEDSYEDFDPIDESKLQDTDIRFIPIVSCPRDHEFCFGCGYENHKPCPCWVVKIWIKKCNDDSETANWIDANTHDCPKCQASIEKNGGCNHMTCSTCRFEFCWICSKEWSIHGTEYYKCNKFDKGLTELLESNRKQKKESLQRYLHFYKRFALHELSMKGDSKTLEVVNEKMNKFMEEQLKMNRNILSWIDVQFLQDAFRALRSGRKTLKWAYCFGFYLNLGNYADVFEHIQEYLSRSVEDLSKIFEQIISKKNKGKSTTIIMNEKQEIINLSALVTKRQKTLIECASSGLNDNILKLQT